MSVLLIIIIIICLYKREQDRKLLRTVTTTEGGTRSERKFVLRLLKSGIPTVTIYHDMYVPKSNGQYSQIDAVVLTKVGIIVFEVKDYSGWLFGNGYHDYWTQVLSYGEEKHRFYNPIKQNASHIASLKEGLKHCADVPFFSVIVFYGNCVLKNVSNIPPYTFIIDPNNLNRLMATIVDNNPPANYADKWGTIEIMKRYVANGRNEWIRSQHIRNVRNILDR